MPQRDLCVLENPRPAGRQTQHRLLQHRTRTYILPPINEGESQQGYRSSPKASQFKQIRYPENSHIPLPERPKATCARMR